jgi:hypothetical protein
VKPMAKHASSSAKKSGEPGGIDFLETGFKLNKNCAGLSLLFLTMTGKIHMLKNDALCPWHGKYMC